MRKYEELIPEEIYQDINNFFEFKLDEDKTLMYNIALEFENSIENREFDDIVDLLEFFNADQSKYEVQILYLKKVCIEYLIEKDQDLSKEVKHSIRKIIDISEIEDLEDISIAIKIKIDQI